MGRFDYDTDVPKHAIRYECWLDPLMQRYNAVQTSRRRTRRKVPFRYLTFCAAGAIDVFMLERVDVIQRDPETRRLANVYFCEMDQDQFGEIVSLFRSQDAGFLGDFAEVVLFEDDDDTRGRDTPNEEEEMPSRAVRERFRLKEVHNRLRMLFPLDAINLDPFSVFFPRREREYSKMLESVKRILQWQSAESAEDQHTCDEFTFLITTHVAEVTSNPAAIDELLRVSQENIDDHDEYRDAFHLRFGHTDPNQLKNEDFVTFYAITFPKVIATLALQSGWVAEHQNIYVYTSEDRDYYMMSYAIRFIRRRPVPGQLPRLRDGYQEYVSEVTRIATTQPTDVNRDLLSQPELNKLIVEDLQAVVNFREDFVRSIES